MTFTPMYSAWTTIEIKDTAPYLAFQKRDNTRSFVQTQMQTIRHPRVLIPALEELAGLPELKDQEDQLAWLQPKIGVVQRGDSELYDITFAGPDPEDAKRIVQAVTEAYLAQHTEEADRHARDIIALLKGEEENREREVEQLRQTARQLAIDNTGIDPYEVRSQQEPAENPAFATIRSQLENAEVETAILEARAMVLEKRLGELRQLKPGSSPNAATDETALSAEEIEQLIAELVPDSMVEQAVSADPEVQLRQEELRAKRSELSDSERLSINGKMSELHKNLVE
ncbi:MAG: hypothetical protein V3R99_00790, partial [Thermoguttaceae bacterium]